MVNPNPNTEQFWIDGFPSRGINSTSIGVPNPGDEQFWIDGFPFGYQDFTDPPICWNYTAQYKNSSKLFKASGCGSFPKNLRVPSNVDTSTGKMVDDGILINPDEYRII